VPPPPARVRALARRPLWLALWGAGSWGAFTTKVAAWARPNTHPCTPFDAPFLRLCASLNCMNVIVYHGWQRPPSGASTSGTTCSGLPALPAFCMPISMLVQTPNAGGVIDRELIVAALLSSLKLYVAVVLETSTQLEPKEKAVSLTISVLPLPEQVIPADLVSGLKLNSRTFPVVFSDWTNDAAIVSTESGREGGQ
jgi:hypothetical protein